MDPRRDEQRSPRKGRRGRGVGMPDEYGGNVGIPLQRRGQRRGVAQAQRIDAGMPQLDRWVVHPDQHRHVARQLGQRRLQPRDRFLSEHAVILPRDGRIEHDHRERVEGLGIVDRRTGGGISGGVP